MGLFGRQRDAKRRTEQSNADQEEMTNVIDKLEAAVVDLDETSERLDNVVNRLSVYVNKDY